MTELSVYGSTAENISGKQSKPRSARPWGVWGLRTAAFSYLAVFILVPLIVITTEGFRGGVETFVSAISNRVAWSAIILTLSSAAIMAVINTLIGTLTAYVLVRYRFPGKPLFNRLVDLPFAIPALVTGVMLVILYGPQTAVGGFFEKNLGLRIIYAPAGIILALLFLGYPFVIRTVQPVLAGLDFNQIQAAYSLGASPWATFRRIILPTIRPAILTGALLSFARSLGEFGSIIIVSGNIDMRTKTAAVYIYGQVEGGNLQAASAVSALLLFCAFGITLVVDLFLRREVRQDA